MIGLDEDHRHRLLVRAVYVVLLWRAGASVVSLVDELTSTKAVEWEAALDKSGEERMRDALTERDAAAGLRSGAHYDLYTLLRDEVPLDGKVYFLIDAADRRNVLVNRVHRLLYPRIVKSVPPVEPAEPVEWEAETFILTFGRSRPKWLQEIASPASESDDWVLWQRPD